MSAHDPGGDSVYTYEPLPNHNNTRLLHLQPGLPGEPLYGSLAISDLYDCGGTYEAISYAWGNSVKPQYISLDDRRLAITESLFTALQRFRSARSVRVLWADAVCIDQANEGERSLQVNRMGQIYRGAASVLVWLGHEDEAHVQAVLRGICEFLEDGAERHDYYWHESQVQTFEGERVLFDPNKGEIDGLLSVCACNWLADLNTRIVRETCTDFVRQSLGSVEAGILQEVALAHTAIIHWGHARFSFEMLAEALIEAGSIEYYMPMLNRPVLNRGLLISAIRKTQQNIDFMVPFSALFGYSRYHEFTNVKDRVYGLLGLQTIETIDTGGALFVVPDYSLSDKACFQQVAEKILIERQDLSFLSRVRHMPDMQTDWPSWVPQWNKWRFTGQIRTSVHSFGSPKEPCIRKEMTGPYTYLCIDGFVIDSVHQILWQNMDSDDGRSSVPFQDYQDVISALSTIYGLHCLLETFGESDTFGNTAFGEWEEHYHTFMEQHADELIYELDSLLLDRGARAFWGAMHKNTSNQVVFTSRENCLGVGPEILEEGDIIAYFYGAQVPFALRPQDSHWRFVGECYMHDFVQCYDIKSWSKSDGQTETFRIV